MDRFQITVRRIDVGILISKLTFFSEVTIEEHEKVKAENAKRISDLESELEAKKREHDIYVKQMAATKAIIEKMLQTGNGR